MNDRELVGVFWGTVAAIPVILGIVWTVNRGLDQQERWEQKEIHDFARSLISKQVDLTTEDYSILKAAFEAEYPSITAPQKADSPLEQPTQQGQR